MNWAVIVPVVLALIAAGASLAGARISRRPVEKSAEFQVWKDSVIELRTSITELKVEVKVCHDEKDAMEDELGGMRTANADLNNQVVILTRRVQAVEDNHDS